MFEAFSLFWKAWGKYILLAIAVLLILAVIMFGVNAIYQRGHAAGYAEGEAASNEAILKLQNQVVEEKTQTAKQVNDRIDGLLKASQESVDAIQLYTAESKKLQQQVLVQIKGQNAKFFDPKDCGRMTPAFQESWDRIRTTKPAEVKK